MSPPILQLTNVSRHFHCGSENIQALDRINLRIEQGDFVAITGPSGSGKSTLMNILGCLDNADEGIVSVLGQAVSQMPETDVARIRAVTLGFVFQSYHLLPDLTALENVAMAGLYAGRSKRDAESRGIELLRQLGLSDRLRHRPCELSGGQQQRVAVARALFHQKAVLLADEPTGALDSKASADLLALFRRLNSEGRTIVIVTHDSTVAAACHRRVQLMDGEIVSDVRLSSHPVTEREKKAKVFRRAGNNVVKNAFFSALVSMRQRLTRTFLTLIGTVVGITAVIVIVALGDGAKQAVVETVGSLGHDLVVVMADWQAERPANADPIKGFTEAERDLVRDITHPRAIVLEMPVTRSVSFGRQTADTLVTGTNADFPLVHNWSVKEGSFFNDQDERAMASVMVIGSKVKDRLFEAESPIGQWVAIGNAYFEVIGIMSDKGASPAGIDLDDVVLVPFSSAVLRLGQSREAQFMMVKAEPNADLELLALQIGATLNNNRDYQEVAARTLANIVALELQTRNTLTLLLSALSLISLLVGSVGITNITLIGVVERTREIGLRKALGARRSDIALQFLVETTLTSIVGGIVGVQLGVFCVLAMQAFGFPALINLTGLAAALMMSGLTGALAGVLPARRAASLHPVAALMIP